MKAVRRYTTAFDDLLAEKGYSSVRDFIERNRGTLDKNTLYSMRRRVHNTRLSTIMNLAEVLDMDPSELISRLYPEFYK